MFFLIYKNQNNIDKKCVFKTQSLKLRLFTPHFIKQTITNENNLIFQLPVSGVFLTILREVQ